MQPLTCISFLLGLVILSATLGPFITIAHRELLLVDGSKRRVEIKLVAGSKRRVEIKLELSVEKTSTGEDIRSNMLTVRKLAFGNAVKKEVKISGSKTSTGAKHSFGKCGHGRRVDLSTNCFFRTRKPPPKDYFDGRIPFAADYGRPWKHPPKNN